LRHGRAGLKPQLNLRFWRGELPRGDKIGEPRSFVGAITEGLVCGVTATAEADGGTTSEAEGLSFGIADFKVAFDAN